MLRSVTAKEISQWRNDGTPHQLIDIREPYEIETCSIGGTSIPMNEIAKRTSEIARNIPVIIHCKSGKRSEAVVAFLERLGFDNAASLEGGILSWIDEVDPTLERY
jgi:adenylyltransferase/sulfurtransferase